MTERTKRKSRSAVLTALAKWIRSCRRTASIRLTHGFKSEEPTGFATFRFERRTTSPPHDNGRRTWRQIAPRMVGVLSARSTHAM